MDPCQQFVCFHIHLRTRKKPACYFLSRKISGLVFLYFHPYFFREINMICCSFHIFHHQCSPDEKIGYSIVPLGFSCKNSYAALFFLGADLVSGKPCKKGVHVIFNIDSHVSRCQPYLTYISRQIKKIFPIFCLLFLLFVNNFYHTHITPSDMRIAHGKCRF